MFVVEKAKTQTFDFQIQGSKKIYKIPLLSQLPMSYIKKANKLTSGTDEDAFEFVNELFEKYAPGVIDELNSEQYRILIESYFESNAITLGE